MLRVYLCDDNNEQRGKIKKIVEDVIMIENLDMEFVLDTNNPNVLLDEVKNSKKTGLYFLDVDLKSTINGIELAEKIREYDPRGFIIFITSHAEMSYLTFLYKVEGLDYIVKDNYRNIKNRVYDAILNANKKYSTVNNTAHKVVSIKSGDKILNIDLDEILFFETSSVIHKINLYTTTGMIEFYSQMKDVEELVDERFIRCHRSYLVNRDKIKYVDYNERSICMIDSSTCYVSVRGMKLLKVKGA